MSTWEPDISVWSQWLVSACRPGSTVYLRTYHVGRLARSFTGRSPWSLTVDDLAGWLAGHDWAVETRRSYASSIRSFYRWAHVTGRIAVDPAALLAPITPPRGVPRPAPEPVYRAAVLGADDRLVLMLRLAWGHGLRRGEIAAVHAGDLRGDDPIGWSLRVSGKGGHVREVPLTRDVAVAIVRRGPGWVFPSPRGGHLTPAHVGRLISRKLDGGWTAHTLRHAFATRAHRAAERDLRVVQTLLGHASIATTQRYVATDDAELRRVVQLVA